MPEKVLTQRAKQIRSVTTAWLQSRADSARRAWELGQVRYGTGLSDFVVAIDSQRNFLLARRELADSEGQRNIRFIAINKAVGNCHRQQSQSSASPKTGDSSLEHAYPSAAPARASQVVNKVSLSSVAIFMAPFASLILHFL